MSEVKVKICGVTTVDDALAALEAGADYIGLNLLRGPRRISPARALEIACAIEAARGERAVEAVLLLTHGTLARMAERADDDGRGCYERVARRQVYGLLEADGRRAEDAGLAHQNDWLPWHAAERGSIAALAALLEHARLRVGAVVLDTAVGGQLGGTGTSFNWQWVAEARAAGELERLPALVLAGGLKPENVAEAVRVARPWAVDVSSGVESGAAGVKDRQRMRAFVAAAKGA